MPSALLVAGAAFSSLLAQAPPATLSTLTVAASPASCAAATSVQVWAVTLNTAPPPGPTETLRVMTQLGPRGGPLHESVTFVSGRAIDAGICRWTFHQLPPGDYVAVLVGPTGSGGSQALRLPADTSITVPPPEVTLSGRVVRNGAPRARVQVRITSFPFGRPAVVVMTDADGRFVVTLDRPGLHRISAYGEGTVERELSSGLNVVDVNTPATRSSEKE